MGNQSSKVDATGNEQEESQLNRDESLVSGSNGCSYENDTFTYQDSKSTVETEFTRPDARKQSTDKPNKRIKHNTGANSANSSKQLQEDTVPSKPITDDQVHVNLAMADLMAYLQVVANNSNNLPLTRRDDPELGRTVSSLTPDEYARKSAAFIPSDVRMIGGCFTRYGRVWDLPTSEEFNACDGAQEPGEF